MNVSKTIFSTFGPLTKVGCVCWKIAASFLLLAGLLLPEANVLAQQQTIFLPLVSTTTANNLQRAQLEQLSACAELISEETSMAIEFLTDDQQQRPLMNCDPTLSSVARARAQDMANRAYFDHVNPDGFGPDILVERAGYNLPYWYPVTNRSNHIESIAYGTSYTTAELAWNALMTSQTHITHLRGETDFFGGQSEFGVGYSYANRRHYWVIISAHPSE